MNRQEKAEIARQKWFSGETKQLMHQGWLKTLEKEWPAVDFRAARSIL